MSYVISLPRLDTESAINTSLGLTCQKPLFKAFQQNKEAVQYWLDKEFPRIKKMAAKFGAKIFFGDEAGIRSDFHAGTTDEFV
jgi:hypothetical protein